MTLHETYKERLEDFDSNFIRGDKHKSDEWFISAKEHFKTTTLALIDSQIEYIKKELKLLRPEYVNGYGSKFHSGKIVSLVRILTYLKEQKELISKEQ